MNAPLRFALSAAAMLVAACGAMCQDLYDTTVLRTFNFQFHDANWMALLRQNYASQTNILADLTVEGVTYANVGVRIRGNTSYTALPTGSEKFSLDVEMDYVVPDQALMGYSSLNLNNGFHDPTFCREVVYNNYAAQFIPNPRANHAIVTLNGQNWGVYINYQQFNKTMLSTHFPDTTGLRIKCANNPNGPGLRYNGSAASGYTGYEIKDDGGLADPWGALINVCNTVTNASATTWQASIDPIFAVDPSIWSVALENILTDDDSYVNKGADFMTYRNPTDGRTFLLQTDANETFTAVNWSPTLNFTASTKPVLSHVLANSELRQRYLSHYRRLKADLNWAYFEPKFTALRNLIDAAVQADPKKLYSYTLFQSNFTSTVTLPYSGPAGGTLVGLQQFVTQRATYLNSVAELAAVGPTISSVLASDTSPDPAQPVSINAVVAPASGGSIAKVELFYRPAPTGVYQRVLMTNLGGGQYSAPLPVAASPGQRVAYYVAATSTNSYASVSYMPERTEWAPSAVEYTFGSGGGVRITEWMYSGPSGEFVEFTNLSGAPVDMTGWSFDDDHAIAGAFGLGGFGIVQPGESVILTEAAPASFRAAWGLGASVKIIGNLGATSGNNLARNDEVNLFDSAGKLVDRLTFGDQTFAGTIRTQNSSGQTCPEAIGQDDVTAWVRSAIGDRYGSFVSTGGEIGTPGTYNDTACNPCMAPAVGTQPNDQSVCPASASTSFSVVPTGTGPLTYRWQVETAPAGSGAYTDLDDGVLAGVAAVSGSATASVTFTGFVPGGFARVRCAVSNACGNTTSSAASLTVISCACNVADIASIGGAPQSDGILTGDDFNAFITAFAAGEPLADIVAIGGEPPADGLITGDDFNAFIAAFANGCP